MLSFDDSTSFLPHEHDSVAKESIKVDVIQISEIKNAAFVSGQMCYKLITRYTASIKNW